MSKKEMTWRDAIDAVLSASPTALHYQEITEKIIAQSLRTSLGATPAATVNAQISTSIKKEGDKSPYVRVDKGTFMLKAGSTVDVGTSPVEVLAVEEQDETDEEQYDIVTSFGMFWRRQSFLWQATPKLLGVQQKGAATVDVSKQAGIYMLYDGREVIYVGRAISSLGKRLYERTYDRLASRWDRFSWFGLLPIADNGTIGNLPEAFEGSKLIPALEAILIEALEPRQNRKRGDDLSAVEFMQLEDPELQKKKVKATLAAAMEKL